MPGPGPPCQTARAPPGAGAVLPAFEVIVLVAILVVCAAVVLDTLRVGAPPMPSGGAARQTLVALLPEAPGLCCWELGAGFGGLALAVARARPGWTVVAWEAALVPYALLRLRAALGGPTNLRVCFGDVLAQPPADRPGVPPPDVFCTYLLGPQMQQVAAWLAPQRRPWTLLSIHFALRSTPPVGALEAEQRAPDLHRTPVFRYRGPSPSPEDPEDPEDSGGPEAPARRQPFEQ